MVESLTGAKRPSPVARIHAELLPSTFKNALRTKFYRQLWSKIRFDRVTPKNLTGLPIVTRHQLQTHGVEAQVRDGIVFEEFMTGGTTNRPFVFIRSREEIEAVYKIRKAAHKHPHGKEYRALFLINPYVARELPIPQPIRHHRINIYQSGSFSHARSVLTSEFTEPGVEPRCGILMGIERLQRAFLDDCRRHAFDGLSSSLEVIYTGGHYLTKALRHQLESYWGCSVIDRYGLSEVMGGATECHHCGFYHLEPSVIGEVVGVNTKEKLTEGVGILVLTALYPFQQAQPLVRYWTGDVVAVTHNSPCCVGEPAIKPLGRAFCGLPDPNSDAWLIQPGDLFEIVDNLPEIERLPLFRDASQISPDHALGHPCYRLDFCPKRRRVTVQVKLRSCSESARNILRDRLRSKLLEKSPLLEANLQAGNFEFSVLAKNHFAPMVISYVP